MIHLKSLKYLAGAATVAAGLFSSGLAFAQTSVVVGYQQIVGPFVTAIADGRFDAAAKEAGYTIDWRQFSSGGDISTALASGNVPIGVIGSTGTTAAATRGVELELFWILDNIGKSEALVVREGSGIEKPEDLKGKNVGVPFVSTSHFHLLVGLEQVWKVDPREVNILNMKPPQILAAWQRGDIDAAYVWPPALVRTAQERQGDLGLRSHRRRFGSDLRRPSRRQEVGGREPQVHGRLHQGSGGILRRLQQGQGRLDGRTRLRFRASSS